MDTLSRPPGCGARPLGRMRAARLQEDASLCILSCPLDIKSPARPPVRHRDWCCSGSTSSPSHRAHRMLQ